MPPPNPKNPWARWALDTLERGVRAFAAAYVSVVGIDYLSEDFNVNTLENLKLAAGTMFVSSMFSLAGKTRGAEDSASFLPENTDPPQ